MNKIISIIFFSFWIYSTNQMPPSTNAFTGIKTKQRATIAKRDLLSFCNWENPLNLSVIGPTLTVQTKNGQQIFNIYNYDQITQMTQTLYSQGLIKNSIVFIIHGFDDNNKTRWMSQMANALLAVDDYTVFLIGWGKGADSLLDFSQAAADTQTVANAVAFTVQSFTKSAPYTYCIGHSLGAHVCGQAGLQRKFDRISGLDPAGPGFQDCPQRPGLNKSSATCVDVIHTNGAPDGFGTLHPLGHVDFYVDCGKDQPECRFYDIACSHSSAWKYFIESITKTNDFIDRGQNKVLRYPTAIGPCNETFLSTCQTCQKIFVCSGQNCLTQRQCSNNTQAMGYGSVCNARKVPVCNGLVDGNGTSAFGLWFVPVCTNGFLGSCNGL